MTPIFESWIINLIFKCLFTFYPVKSACIYCYVVCRSFLTALLFTMCQANLSNLYTLIQSSKQVYGIHACFPPYFRQIN